MIKEFAEYFSLTIWDWFTAIVAVISLIVAVFAFVIAIKTYHVSKKTLCSQQQTEKNTTPTINKEIQEIILNKMIVNLYFDRIELKALWTLLKSKNYTYYVVDAIWADYIIDVDSIHYELFYNESDNFETIEQLRKRIKDYNKMLLSLKEAIREQANHDAIEVLFRTLFRIIYLLPTNFIAVQNKVFSNNEPYLISLNHIYYNNIEMLNPTDTENQPMYFDENDIFLTLIGIPQLREKILRSTNANVKIHIERLSHYLIECKNS